MTPADWYRLARSYVKHARLAVAVEGANLRRRAWALASRERWLAMARDARDQARAARRDG